MSEPEYRYGERKTRDMSKREFVPGSGRIAGYLSAGLGLMSFLGVLCFRYPSWLTTAELRATYNVDTLRVLLWVCITGALGFGLFNVARYASKRKAAVGILSALAALALGGGAVETGVLKPVPLSLGLDFFLISILSSGAVYIVLEKLFPRYREQVITRPAWKLDAAYFTVNHLLISVLLLAGNSFAPAVFGWAVNADFQRAVQGLPLAAEILVVLLAADFVQYWIHRAYHEVPALWKLHAIHHSAEHLDWLAGSRTHIVQVLLDRTLVLVPLYLLGPSKQALDAYVIIAAVQAVGVHANLGLNFGPLKYLLVTPQYHHWHHSSDRPAIDTNYAVHLPLWDALFGTWHMPEAHWPIEYGTVKPVPRSMWRQFLYPFGLAE
jgi:sterol desaturase/sphingolipid hydroxylase (fatty acid hydroxylase superfamily)